MLMFYLSLLEGDDNKALFTAFYTRYRARLYAVALNILKDPALAEDAVHEAFLRVIGHFETFLKIFEKERNKIGPWAVTIVKNISLDLLRKKNRSEFLPEDWDAPAPGGTEGEAGYRRLVEPISSMPEAYLRPLELEFICEYSDREIADDLGITLGAARQRIRRGRVLLIRKLKEEGYDHETV